MWLRKAVRETGRPFLFLAIGGGIALALAAILLQPASGPEHWWQEGPALPALTGRVVDEADLLSPDRQASLEARLASFESATHHQFVIVIVKSLNGQQVESFGLRLGRSWGIGRKGVNDGVLLIVAPNERKVRIEVGWGLERVLSDPVCAKIIREQILPPFRNGAFAEGIDAGSSAIIALLATSQHAGSAVR